MHSVSKAINIKHAGDSSPVLNPVQTPLEDLPMTPLYLNSEESYFVLTNNQNAYRYKGYKDHEQEFDESTEVDRDDPEEYNMMDTNS